jgi:hypothetical protein
MSPQKTEAMIKKMHYILTAFLLLTLTITKGQDRNEFEIHLKSIDNTYPQYSTENTNRTFVDYTIKHLLAKPTDKYFISNRNLLTKLKPVSCDSFKTTIEDTLKSGEVCEIRISTKTFQPANHKIVTKSSNQIKSIDRQYPYGAQYQIPEIEIDKFEITINGKQLLIPKNSFGNLYQPNMCKYDYFGKPIEVYTSLDNKYIYVYIFGGNAAETYFCKLIFDKQKYLTRIISDYYPLSIHGSFRKDFVGF